MSGNTSTSKRRRRPYFKILAAMLLLGGAAYWGFTRQSTPGLSAADEKLTLAPVTRMDLTVDVVEAASIDAAESQIIRSSLEGRSTIISIVGEGTIITQEDVKDGKILIQLDSAELRDREAQQEITVQGASATLTEASETYEITRKQNESDLETAKLTKQFALMDLNKYLGIDLAAKYLESDLSLLEELIRSVSPELHLDGQALQTWRELDNTRAIESIEYALAIDKYNWTKKLFDQGYVSKNDLDVDELAVKRSDVAIEKAKTAIDLFIDYEFIKESERLKSDYEEAGRELDRVISKNRAEISKADAQLKSAMATFTQQVDQLKKIQDQVAKTTIRATHPGLVVYAGSDQPWRNQPVEEGAEVRERQELIKIPNTTAMLARAKVHESVISRVKEGQKVFITIDAMPDKQLTGTVRRVAVLPDSGDRFMNPDTKVYQTEITIDQGADDLKPGLSARVRIIINELDNVLAVPVQAVRTRSRESRVLVKQPNSEEWRVVETGEYNEKYIQILSGVEEGQFVVLNAGTFDTAPVEEQKPESQTEGSDQTPTADEPPVEQNAPPMGGEEQRRGRERGREGGRDGEGERGPDAREPSGEQFAPPAGGEERRRGRDGGQRPEQREGRPERPARPQADAPVERDAPREEASAGSDS